MNSVRSNNLSLKYQRNKEKLSLFIVHLYLGEMLQTLYTILQNNKKPSHKYTLVDVTLLYFLKCGVTWTIVANIVAIPIFF